jgi:adenylate kinase
VVGLSGVGKSTLIRRIGESVDVVHLEASTLIKSELLQQRQSLTSDQLRRGDIARNQELLIAGFQRATADCQVDRIILDGHVLVDTDSGVIDIPSSVFDRLGITSFCFVHAEPEEIVRRRLADQTRMRPHREVSDISAQQDLGLIVCARIARDLKVPIVVITAEIPNRLADALEGR